MNWRVSTCRKSDNYHWLYDFRVPVSLLPSSLSHCHKRLLQFFIRHLNDLLLPSAIAHSLHYTWTNSTCHWNDKAVKSSFCGGFDEGKQWLDTGTYSIRCRAGEGAHMFLWGSPWADRKQENGPLSWSAAWTWICSVNEAEDSPAPYRTQHFACYVVLNRSVSITLRPSHQSFLRCLEFLHEANKSTSVIITELTPPSHTHYFNSSWNRAALPQETHLQCLVISRCQVMIASSPDCSALSPAADWLALSALRAVVTSQSMALYQIWIQSDDDDYLA